jgi:isopenicillin N synthase-like dioxygenase
MARWTNRVIHANHHRVLNPPGAGAPTLRRQSIVFARYPAWEATVTPAPSCVARTGEALPPLRVGEHYLRSQGLFSARDERALQTDTKD